MADYFIQLFLHRVVCRNTESLHSSDKFALAGACLTDVATQGFVFPMMRINTGEWRRFDNEQAAIFAGVSSYPKIGLVLKAYDLDENDAWPESRETIVNVSKLISDAVALVPGYGSIISLVLDGAILVIPPIIDGVVHFDANDVLLDYREWVDAPSAGAYNETAKDFTVNFARHDPTGYSDWDYSLDFTVVCTYQPSFGSPVRIPESNLEPMQNSTQANWLGVWKGGGIVADVRSFGVPNLLNVTIREQVDDSVVTTETHRVATARMLVELQQVAPSFRTRGPGGGNVGSSQPGSSVGSVVFNQAGMRHRPLAASLVRERRAGARNIVRENMLGSEGLDPLGPVSGNGVLVNSAPPTMTARVTGDYVSLNNGATLEIYRVISGSTAVAEALRYRRPSSDLLAVAPGGVDHVLHRYHHSDLGLNPKQ